ncbi:MAG: DNA cytosine methyltransferase, partial [Victivallales bacterium]|nr:DNA cytosine methyltransferase [Victivallales bacterium]
GTGVSQAAAERGMKVSMHAVNHWERAIETHAHNHPEARHYCTGVDALDPCETIRGGRVDLLWASPECTHHSDARGGRPRSNQSRASAWCILKWLVDLYVPRVIIENVAAFLKWGPLDENGKRIKEREGEIFKAWVGALRSLGYRVDWRILNAADYGAPQSRERLFIQAVRDTRRIVWPSPSHAEIPKGQRLPWLGAREVIDWSDPGRSIFGRKKPLCANTMRRIEEGIRRYWGEWAEPFLVILKGQSTVRRIGSPVPTVTCGGSSVGVVSPFLTQGEHGMRIHSVDRPLPTITTSGRNFGVVSPFVTAYHGGRDAGDRVSSGDRPLPTVDCSNRFGLVSPLILHQMRPGATRTVDQPLPTVLAQSGHALVMPYYRTGVAKPVGRPLDTVSCTDRFALVQGMPLTLDICLRMFRPPELAGAQGFPDGYWFSGNQGDQVRQIGNAVPCPVARAIAAAAFDDDNRSLSAAD